MFFVFCDITRSKRIKAIFLKHFDQLSLIQNYNDLNKYISLLYKMPTLNHNSSLYPLQFPYSVLLTYCLHGFNLMEEIEIKT